ncbi:uncharacterized protein [Anabrus simplex]|uniref:uncharacterized protein isoform X2 n=1 Tax=Anabrus simplex TaxID=316456 RepID=UPI0034DD827C
MQFAQSFPTMETPRPSMFGQFMPMTQQGQGQDPPAGWLQVPPTHMPWGIPSQPSIVRFTAERPLPDPRPVLSGTMPFAQCKRKIEPDMEVKTSVKQHITEEKMAAHMSQLHISQDYTPHQTDVNAEPDRAQPGPSTVLSGEETQYKRLVLCDELRQLKSEPILPSSLLAKMEKPTMALVLWQPPAGNVGEALRNAATRATTSTTKTEAEEEEERRRQLLQQQPVSVPSGPIFPILDNNNTSAAVNLNSLALPGADIVHGSLH